MIRAFFSGYSGRGGPDFDEAVQQYVRARRTWEDQWGPDPVDVTLQRLLHIGERLWALLRPPAPGGPLPPGALSPQVVEAMNHPTLAHLLAKPYGALLLTRLLEREEQRLLRESERGIARNLGSPGAEEDPPRLARARAATRDPQELHPARPARFARARPLREYAQERDEDLGFEEREDAREDLDHPPPACGPRGAALDPGDPVEVGAPQAETAPALGPEPRVELVEAGPEAEPAGPVGPEEAP